MVPEYNENAFLTLPSTQGIVRNMATGEIVSTSEMGERTLRHRVRYRPASRSNPVDSYGWRNPSAWSHYGWENNPCPVGTLIVYNVPSPGLQYEMLDGSGWSGVGDIPPPFPGDEVDRALGLCLSRLKNQDVNLSVALGERKETAELAVDAFKRAAKLVRAWKGKYFKDFLKAAAVGGRTSRGPAGTFAVSPKLIQYPNSFLEVQYGIKPLYQDVYGAARALESGSPANKPGSICSKGSAKHSSSLTWRKPSSYSSNIGFDVDQRIDAKAFVRLDYFLENPFLRTLSQLGFTNPADTAWELLPFSFIADWGVPLGTWLSQMDADFGLTFRGGSWSSVVKLEMNGSFRVVKTPGYPDAVWHGVPYRYRGFRFTRGVYGSTPFPPWGLKSPFDSGGQHVANAIALVASALGGGKSRRALR